jgi:hypothetical protein
MSDIDAHGEASRQLNRTGWARNYFEVLQLKFDIVQDRSPLKTTEMPPLILGDKDRQ